MDVANPDEARRVADSLGDSVSFYKLGLELFMAGGYFELLDWMVGRGKKVFVTSSSSTSPRRSHRPSGSCATAA